MKEMFFERKILEKNAVLVKVFIFYFWTAKKN
jgi:hypothetical protein